MSKHVDLFGNVLPPREPHTPVRVRSTKGVLYPWSGVCCKACYFARRDMCTCKCGGRYHGLGSRQVEFDKHRRGVLTPKQSKPFREKMTRDKCECGADLSNELISYRTERHKGGWMVEGFLYPVWLYIECPRCHIDRALWKLGVKRE